MHVLAPCAAGRLIYDGTAWVEEHRIRGYEVGPDQKTTISTIANLLQARTATLQPWLTTQLPCARLRWLGRLAQPLLRWLLAELPCDVLAAVGRSTHWGGTLASPGPP
jgi:hypothetical protein